MKPADETLEARIRTRAYHLWQQDGRPQGRDEEFWERVCELIAIEDHPAAGQLPNPLAHGEPPEREQPVEPIEAVENQGRVSRSPHPPGRSPVGAAPTTAHEITPPPATGTKMGGASPPIA
jgi:hypothetical protein